MSKYTAVYLKSDDYDSFYDACDTAGLVSDSEIVTASHNYQLILVGDMYEYTGTTTTDDDGNETADTELLDGYYAMLNYKTSVGLEDLEVTIDSPTIKFAGS